MATVTKQGSNGKRHPPAAHVRCPECKAEFTYEPDDVQVDLTLMGGAAFWYVRCPNDHCQRWLIVEDCRTFGPLWRWLNSESLAQFLSY